MADQKNERREFKRYSTEVKIYFDFAYDLETKVQFELVDGKKGKTVSKKYSAVSRNISVEGLSFVSSHKVEISDLLHLELYLPSAKDPIHMMGEVRWCNLSLLDAAQDAAQKTDPKTYHVGIKLISVANEPVHESIHYDKEYDVKWSIVLESVFGSYKMLMGNKYKSDPQ